MVCKICGDMLGRQDGRFAKGTLDLKYGHHTDVRTFQQSVQQNCYICRALYNSLLDNKKRNATLQPRRDSTQSSTHAVEESPDLSQTHLRSSASLSVLQVEQSYGLEIVLKHDQNQFRHTFHLEHRDITVNCPDRKSVHVQYRVPENPTLSPRNLPDLTAGRKHATALGWLKGCKCYSRGTRSFYPARLISLETVKAVVATDGSSSTRDSSEAMVNIVETKSWSGPGGAEAGYNGGNKEYVTLSHCWGGDIRQKLTRGNYKQYTQGILVHELPKTFQDAVYFAASMEDVGYLWIDSLCIIQNDIEDWLLQSATMDRVYSETFLNLSATASLNSHGGLFRHRDCTLLEEEEVLLNIEGLPLAYDRKSVPTGQYDRECHFLRQCIVKDASFWDNTVDRGPVNSRGWVLQERLMSPRVLHFCLNQVGWECACSQIKRDPADEGQTQKGSANHRSRYDSIVEGIQQFSPHASSGAGANAPLSYTHLDIWADIVNAYTRTAITDEQDIFLALSGIAKVLAEKLQCAYIAGLWRTNLASQLLWYVEPVYHALDRSFSNPAALPKKHPDRAPTFSWAAINVTGHGITYPKSTQSDLVIHIEDTSIETLTDNEFGIVSKARIFLQVQLFEARLISASNNRFAWHTVDLSELDDELHKNIYLDCPKRDLDCIDNPNAAIYILPVAKECTYRGTSSNEYLYCLMLRPDLEPGVFKRIGMTKLSPSGDRKAMERVQFKGKDGYKILGTLSSKARSSHRDTSVDRICLI